MRIALGLEYDGGRFHGFERQVGPRTVQEELERAIGKVAATENVRVICAGRTDAGVHAAWQVVHFDSDARRPLKAWVQGVNRYLADDAAVLWAQPVSDRFHARFSATGRRYRYRILNRPIRPAIEAGRVAWEYRPLDARSMHRAAQSLVGEHDFTSFRAAGCQARQPVRRLYRIDVTRKGQYITIDIHANAFLQQMVRIIAGTLIAVGANERPLEWPASLLAARDRRLAGITAPPAGLCLVGIDYPATFALPVPTADERDDNPHW
ncbi:tRNA pseudouridine(38-40) synthase TruA [Thioalkalivibrio sp. HK1]|uniref:tRNA pseudouridine(38-40) synthase TruA n=1 Tax=Thioalkalivibrio sp. HK1 TaxID=1469245 RepID=UPI00046F2635|nr:tRNA pseudouridine(38-40) synthase TruA [Thioalkalivibrio sp. HK1]